MGRRPKVARDTALDRVMRRYWAQGYEATSIDDLLQATGMHRGSFYRVFGDKRSSFMAALAHYGQMVADEDLTPALAGGGSPRRRLLRLVHARLDAALGLRGDRSGARIARPGCLMVNTAIEVAPHDQRARVAVARSLASLRAAIGQLVDQAIEAGDGDGDVDRDLAADQIFTLLQGVNVLSCAGGDRRQLRHLLTHTVDSALGVTAQSHARTSPAPRRRSR